MKVFFPIVWNNQTKLVFSSTLKRIPKIVEKLLEEGVEQNAENDAIVCQVFENRQLDPRFRINFAEYLSHQKLLVGCLQNLLIEPSAKDVN